MPPRTSVRGRGIQLMRARHEVKAGSEVRFIAGRVAKEGKHERVSADLVAADRKSVV